MKVKVIRGGQVNPLIRQNDTFNSIIEIYGDDGRLMKTVYNVNTDFCNGYKGGILAEGTYGGMVIDRKDNGKRAVKLFNYYYYDKIHKEADVWEPMRVFDSLIPNPNQGNKKLISQVLIHCDILLGGASHGCITIYPNDWLNFIQTFQLNDILTIEIVRAEGWKAPSIYQGA